MPYKLLKTPDPNNAHDRLTVCIEFADDLTVDELLESFASFMKAVGFAPYTLSAELEPTTAERSEYPAIYVGDPPQPKAGVLPLGYAVGALLPKKAP